MKNLYNKQRKEIINKKIEHYLTFDIETLKYLRIFFVKSKNDGDTILKQIPFSLAIGTFCAGSISVFLFGSVKSPLFFNIFLGLTCIFPLIYLIYLTIIVPQKYNEELLYLEILEYCIDLKERFLGLDYTELLDKVHEASGKERKR
jgi:hypothetical protein